MSRGKAKPRPRTGNIYILKMRALNRVGLRDIIHEEFFAANDAEAKKTADEILASKNKMAVDWKCVPIALYAQRTVVEWPEAKS